MVANMMLFPVALLTFPMESFGILVLLYAPQSLLASTATTPPYCIICWSLCPQDTCLSLGVHVLLSQRLIIYHNSVSDM